MSVPLVDGGGRAQGAGPVPVPAAMPAGADAVAAVACGGEHTVVLCADGTLRASAQALTTRLGAKVDVPQEAKRPLALAAGAYHSLVADARGCVYAWGAGAFATGGADGCIPALGQPGRLDEATTPVRVPLPSAAVRLAAGAYHSAVATENNQVLTFGAAQLGQLGRKLPTTRNPATDSSNLPVDATPRPVEGLPAGCQPASLGAGFYTTYIACKDRKGLHCAGENQNAQCGATNPTNILEMTAVPELAHEAVDTVDGGYCHTVVLTKAGRVITLGCGEDGQRGDGVLDGERKPCTDVPLPHKASEAVAGLNHTVVRLEANGEVYAWGSNEYGQLGVDGDDPHPHPVRVPLPAGVRAARISAGSTHTAILDTSGVLWTFGGGGQGQLLRGGTDDVAQPAPV